MLRRANPIYYYSTFLTSLFAFMVVVNSRAFVTERKSQVNKQLYHRFQQETSKFIGESIVSSHLSNCSVIMIVEIGTIQNSQSIPSTFSSEMTTMFLYLINTNTITTITLISSLHGRNEKTNTTSLKFTSTCKFVISVLIQLTQEFSSLILQLKSASGTFTRKDEDHFMFITMSESTSTSLLYSPIASLLRYKIVFHPSGTINNQSQANSHEHQETKVSFAIRTSCIYCQNNQNRIMLVSIPTAHTLKHALMKHVFPDPTHNLQQHSVRISGPIKYLSTYQMERINGKYRHKRGIHTLVFNTVATKINMSYTLQPCSKFGNIPEGASGVLLGNGTWAGCMGDVVRGISDIALSVSPDDRRFQAVHFTSAMEYTYVTFTTAKPQLFYSWKSVFTALEATIWGLVIASILVTSTAIHLTDHYREMHNHLSNTTGKLKLNRLFETGLYLTGYVVGQGIPLLKSSASKSVYMNWLFYGLVLGAAYSCSLQSVIVSPGLDYVPSTFSQLVNSHYKWGASSAFRNGLGEQLFKHSNNSVMREVYHKMDGDKDEVICTRKALGQYACFNWEIMQRFHLKTEFADKSGNHPFQMATETAFFTSLNFITRKRELYRSHFNNFMSRAFDSGLIKQMIAMDWRKYRMDIVKAKKDGEFSNISNTRETHKGPKPFKFTNVKGCFIVLFCGLITSMVSYFLEKVMLNSLPETIQ